MGRKKTIKSTVQESRASKAGRVIFFNTVGQPQYTDRDYRQLAEEGYQQNVIVFRCISLRAQALANLPWTVVRDGEYLTEHPALDLLMNPNPMESGQDFLERLSTFFDISGNAYIEYTDENDGELFVLRPDPMKMIPDGRGYPEAYEYQVSQEPIRWTVNPDSKKQQPILHIRHTHPTNDAYGFSPIAAGAFSVDIHNSASSFQKAFLDNGARPSGALVYKGEDGDAQNLTDKQFNKLKAEIEEVYSGPSNAGRPLIFEDLEWVEMGKSPRDLDFVEGKRETAREIALALGVPPMLLGLPGDNTYANFAEANRVLYRQGIIPTARKIARALTHFLAPTFGDDWRFDFDEDKVPALEPEREMRFKKYALANWLSYQEKRIGTGFSRELADGEELHAANGLNQGDRGTDNADRDSRDLGKKDSTPESKNARNLRLLR